jgi:hypothetical protein
MSGQLHGPCCFTPKEKVPSTHYKLEWVGTRAGLDGVEKKKSLASAKYQTYCTYKLKITSVFCFHSN